MTLNISILWHFPSLLYSYCTSKNRWDQYSLKHPLQRSLLISFHVYAHHIHNTILNDDEFSFASNLLLALYV